MTKLELIQKRWNKKIDYWQEEIAKSLPIPEEHQSPNGKRDCWRGIVHPLMNMALEVSGTEFRIPDRVKDEQEKQGERYVGDSGVEIFGDLASVVPRKRMRSGDVVVFIFQKETHVALVIDKRYVVHATDKGGVCRARHDSVLRVASKVLRYNGPGSDVFG